MMEKFISRFAESLFLRLLVTGVVVVLPVGFTTSWLGAAYLNLMMGANFVNTLFGLLVFGGTTSFVIGMAILYPIERWFIRDKATTSWKWVLVRILIFMLAGIPEGVGTLVSLRTINPAIGGSYYYVQAITVSSVIGILYTLIERVIKEIRAREGKLKLKIEELRIEINDLKRRESVDEIANSEFFQDLKEEAAKIRQRSKRSA